MRSKVSVATKSFAACFEEPKERARIQDNSLEKKRNFPTCFAMSRDRFILHLMHDDATDAIIKPISWN
jgi:hypothetical protein